jgi:hypothetical protein
MEISLTFDQETYLAQIAARTGRSADEAVQEALAEWVDRQTALLDFRATLDEAQASIVGGEGIEITQDSMRDLAEDVKRRGLERVAAKRLASR